MARTIIFRADGTWNGPGETHQDAAAKPSTNVLNLQGTDSTDSMMPSR